MRVIIIVLANKLCMEIRFMIQQGLRTSYATPTNHVLSGVVLMRSHLYTCASSMLFVAQDKGIYIYVYIYIYTYKRVVCVCLLVCLSVFFLSATRQLSTLRRCLRVLREQPSRRGRPRAPRGQAHAQREHARACRTTSQRKNRCADAFQKQNRTRARMLSYT